MNTNNYAHITTALNSQPLMLRLVTLLDRYKELIRASELIPDHPGVLYIIGQLDKAIEEARDMCLQARTYENVCDAVRQFSIAERECNVAHERANWTYEYKDKTREGIKRRFEAAKRLSAARTNLWELTGANNKSKTPIRDNFR